MAETTSATEALQAPAEQSALLQRLATMEDLLREQTKQNKKLARSRGVMALLMALLVVVFAVGLYWLNNTVSYATRELPQLIESTNASMEQLKTTLEDISSIDFATLNDTMGEIESGLGSVDFEALNQSIVDLQKVVESLRSFLDLFG